MFQAQTDLSGVQPRVLLATPGADSQVMAVAALLRERQCLVVHCEITPDAVLRALVVLPHLVIVAGQNMPDLLDACHRLRAATAALILVLGRGGDETEEVLCLESGADRYLALPVSPRLLEAQLAALLRRALAVPSRGTPAPVLFGVNRIDMQRRRVHRDGIEVMLSHKEYGLFAFLVEHAGQTVTRQALSRFVWGTEAADDSRSLDVHIHWLREKLEQDAHNPRHIRTVRGVGYCFEMLPDSD